METLIPRDLLRTGEVLLEATAYGDAAGLPAEMLSAQQIQEKYGGITRLIAPLEHDAFSDEHQPGVCSDDTRLSMAVAEGLIAANGFDMHTQAEAHIRAYEDTPKVANKHGEPVPRGWGGSTYRSVERLIQGISPYLSGEFDPSDPKKGAGNGVLMKLAPLVFWQVARKITAEERYRQYDTLTNMTHNHPVARLTSRVHGDFLHTLLQLEQGQMAVFEGGLAEDVITSATYHEKTLGQEGVLSDLLAYLTRTDLAGRPSEILSRTDGAGFYAPQTLAMAYGIFLLNMSDFETTVYRAVNLGGDTDSIASITANLLNFVKKGCIILPEDAKYLRERDRLQRVSKSLTQAAMKGLAV